MNAGVILTVVDFSADATQQRDGTEARQPGEYGSHRTGNRAKMNPEVRQDDYGMYHRNPHGATKHAQPCAWFQLEYQDCFEQGTYQREYQNG